MQSRIRNFKDMDLAVCHFSTVNKTLYLYSKVVYIIALEMTMVLVKISSVLDSILCSFELAAACKHVSAAPECS